MEEKHIYVLKKLLNYEFDNIIDKLGFDHVINYPNKEFLLEAIGVLDNITIQSNINDKSIVITIIALLWELYGKEYTGLKDILIKMLSRIGYSPASIIMDDKFDIEKQQFSGLNSIINELSISINQAKYEIYSCGQEFMLTDFQKQVNDIFDNNDIIGISAPTSAGKSFILTLKSVEYLMKNKVDIIYIVPTLSLVAQVSEDYKKMLKKINYQDCNILNTYRTNFQNDKRNIYVLTQEKAISAFLDENQTLKTKTLLIVDEIQNIERINYDNDTRAKILFDAIFEFRNREIINKAIISGPRIDEIGELSNKLFGVDNSKKIETSVSPVLSLTYSIKKEKEQYFLKQYCPLFKQPISRKIKNDSIIKGYEKKTYTNEFLEYLNLFLDKFDVNEQNIIFAPTSKTSRNIAMYISDLNKYTEDKLILELISYLEDSVHPEYSLCLTLKSKVAYHHGKLPMHVRKVIEKAATTKLINNLVCTTTLMQGVNLPAQNIIIRNPHLYERKQKNSSELSGYEMANLRGRAGRLLKDFIGRTYVLDENEFLSVEEDYNQIEVFGEVSKGIEGSYESKFLEYEESILESLRNNSLVTEVDDKFGYLVTYIRQTILRHGKKAHKYLNDVGISITKKEVNRIKEQLEVLQIPKEICLKNRYWDPMILEALFKDEIPDLPQVAMERGNQKKLREALKFLRENDKYQSIYYKHMPNQYCRGKGLTKVCGHADKWANQTPLREILDTNSNKDNIGEILEESIVILQQVVSYTIPLLLAPLYDIKYRSNSYLACLESGSNTSAIKQMIEMGIPRETSLYLHTNYLNDIKYSTDENLYELIIDRLRSIYIKLPYWIAIQIEYLM
ncbi:DEAD/DEAH box helicase [Turicibacter sanguinis]|uniref:DEAD/DEAH box helicase n=1 Tax=Turicibacter sanguinis TaxID=154288 RepID=UPI00399639C7